MISNPPISAELTVAETEVFAANSPNPAAWTDLDLSGVVGARRALVVLKVVIADTKVIAIRRNGDTDTTYSALTAMGTAALDGRAGIHVYLIVETDGAGIIEWYCEVLDTAVTFDVVSFIA